MSDTTRAEPLLLVDPAPRAAAAECESIFAEMEQHGGFNPTSFLVMAHRPAVLRAYYGFTLATRALPATTPEIRSVAAHTVSLELGCTYCRSHQAWHARRNGFSDLLVAAACGTGDARTTSAAELGRAVAAADSAAVHRAANKAVGILSGAEIGELALIAAQFAFLWAFNGLIGVQIEPYLLDSLAELDEQIAACGGRRESNRNPKLLPSAMSANCVMAAKYYAPLVPAIDGPLQAFVSSLPPSTLGMRLGDGAYREPFGVRAAARRDLRTNSTPVELVDAVAAIAGGAFGAALLAAKGIIEA